ncbi:ABC transporter permease [Capillimicrobium parvum]|uniref:Ribose import permease protein RbsC n=1 Tax=Capillimicrobium parvum TaxID=2884022 RepID=A0A9E6Y2F6_9ACTN|nr:ABC transporter permease [Capillimicrobium parvum]UGS38979.1 Ribose import permease protein RbsC [Capillimicrobium parvum]
MSDGSDATPKTASERSAGRARLRVTPLTVITGAVIVLLAVSQFFVTSNFFKLASLSTLTPLIGIMIIVATGQAFVVSTGGIDLSVPAVMTLMGSIVLKESAQQSDNLPKALLTCAVVCVVIGLLNGVLVEILRLNALVVTLAVGQLVFGAMRLYRGDVLTFTNVPSNLSDAAGADLGGVSYLFIFAILFALASTFFLHRIVPGRRLVASSAAARAATLAGVRARSYRVFAYVLAALAYGIGGVLAAGQVGTPDLTLGDPYLLSSVVAVVLGGAVLTGGRVSPVATLLGAVFITVLDYDLRVKGYSAGVRLIVQGAVLALGLSLVFVIQNLPRIRQGYRSLRPGSPDGAQATTT